MKDENVPKIPKEMIASWVLRKLATGQYSVYFSDDPNVSWEFWLCKFVDEGDDPTLVRKEEDDIARDNWKFLDQLAEGIVSNPGVWKPLFPGEDHPSKENILKLLARTSLINTPLAHASGKHILNMKQRLSSTGAETTESIISGAQSNAFADSLLSGLLDDLGSRMPEMFDRAQELQVLGVGTSPSETSQKYIVEAAKSFINGCFLASAILCRSAIEIALKDILVRHVGLADNPQVDEMEMWQLIDFAKGKLAWQFKSTLDDADKIRCQTNSIVHGKPVDRSAAKEIFIGTRTVLKELYSEGRSIDL